MSRFLLNLARQQLRVERFYAASSRAGKPRFGGRLLLNLARQRLRVEQFDAVFGFVVRLV
jgi:hypothetical protein